MVKQLASLCLALVMSCAAQDRTREEELRQRRSQEGGVYGDDEPTRLEKAATWAEETKLLDRLSRGFGGLRLVFGNLLPGAGFALGPEYLRDDLKDGAVVFRTSVRGSTKQFLLADAELSLPRLASRRLFVDAYTRWRNLAAVPYYGPGPESRKSGRTAFRIEDVSYDFSAGVQPFCRARLGVTGGFLRINVGPGDESRYASTEQVYSAAQVPGLTQQTNFLHGGVLASYDGRDYPSAKKGGYYEARFDLFSDRDLRQHSHRRLTLEAQQYLPLANRRRVIALRAKTLLTYDNRNQVVPFYLQSVVGGPNDLRGFRFGRFWDNNALVLNAEYRWEIFTGLDGALFYDAGKVFPRPGQLNFRNLEGAAGFGFRVNARNTTFLRIDTGFSHEGFQVWFSFNDLFGNTGGVAQSLYASRAGVR